MLISHVVQQAQMIMANLVQRICSSSVRLACGVAAVYLLGSLDVSLARETESQVELGLTPGTVSIHNHHVNTHVQVNIL